MCDPVTNWNAGGIMIYVASRTAIAVSAILLASVLTESASNAQSSAPAQTLAAKMICGPHSAAPKRLRAYQADIVFTVDGDRLKAERKTQSGADETFTGLISPTGLVTINGKGTGAKGGAWILEFRGQRQPVKDTVLTGRLESTVGDVGQRTCKMVFIKQRSL
jgi:hypothetical protein